MVDAILTTGTKIFFAWFRRKGNIMEKICIVKRRMMNTLEVNNNGNNELRRDLLNYKTENYVFEESTGESKQDISLNLTPEQSKIINSSNQIKTLLENKSNVFVSNIQQQKNGQIVFNFHLDKENTKDLLKTKQVCQKLQISQSFLLKLVKEKKIKSYKIGRLRRFSIEDVMDYVTENVEVKKYNL